jgi:hypothetical protein
MRLPHRPEVVERGADVDHRAALRLQVRQRRARDVERPLQIDVDDGAEPVGREVLDQADEVAGGTVDHDVEPSEVGHHAGLRRR